MPLYEFHCGKCGADSEILVRSTRWKGAQCPKCGSTKLTKQFSSFASTVAGGAAAGPVCMGQTKSCGLCGTGKPHSH
ncbi:MAG TPA: zinc ribbon domain-containing protein [Verrucomicrobiae bacterium]|nr:zinc ribbon domain-containing protein [Verrucomicrobiae bacterium]